MERPTDLYRPPPTLLSDLFRDGSVKTSLAFIIPLACLYASLFDGAPLSVLQVHHLVWIFFVVLFSVVLLIEARSLDEAYGAFETVATRALLAGSVIALALGLFSSGLSGVSACLRHRDLIFRNAASIMSSSWLVVSLFHLVASSWSKTSEHHDQRKAFEHSTSLAVAAFSALAVFIGVYSWLEPSEWWHLPTILVESVVIFAVIGIFTHLLFSNVQWCARLFDPAPADDVAAIVAAEGPISPDGAREPFPTIVEPSVLFPFQVARKRFQRQACLISHVLGIQVFCLVYPAVSLSLFSFDSTWILFGHILRYYAVILAVLMPLVKIVTDRRLFFLHFIAPVLCLVFAVGAAVTSTVGTIVHSWRNEETVAFIEYKAILVALIVLSISLLRVEKKHLSEIAQNEGRTLE